MLYNSCQQTRLKYFRLKVFFLRSLFHTGTNENGVQFFVGLAISPSSSVAWQCVQTFLLMWQHERVHARYTNAHNLTLHVYCATSRKWKITSCCLYILFEAFDAVVCYSHHCTINCISLTRCCAAAACFSKLKMTCRIAASPKISEHQRIVSAHCLQPANPNFAVENRKYFSTKAKRKKCRWHLLARHCDDDGKGVNINLRRQDGKKKDKPNN